MVILRRSKGAGGRRQQNPGSRSDESKEKAAKESEEKPDSELNSLQSSPAAKEARRKRNCVDSCCWFVGCISSVW